MIKGHTDIDIWNTGFFINADYFSDDFIIYNNTGKDLTRKTLAHPFFHNNSYKTTYTSFILCLSGTSEIESVVPFLVPVISVTIWELKSFAAFIGPPFSAYAVL